MTDKPLMEVLSLDFLDETWKDNFNDTYRRGEYLITVCVKHRISLKPPDFICLNEVLKRLVQETV